MLRNKRLAAKLLIAIIIVMLSGCHPNDPAPPGDTAADGLRVYAGGSYTIVLTSEGRVYSWGTDHRGNLGLGRPHDPLNPVYHHNPTQVGIQERVTQVWVGPKNVFALTEDGSLWAWGANVSGQLGDGTTVDRFVPTKVQIDVTVRQMGIGYDHTIMLSEAGDVYAWGRNDYGALGNGTIHSSLVPTAVDFDIEDSIVQIAAAGGHSLALTSAGDLYGWGYNEDGEIAGGFGHSVLSPVLIETEEAIKMIAAGPGFSLAVTDRG